MSQPVPITDAEFEASVLRSELPVIVDFWAPWCMPCKMIAPVLEEIAKEYDGQIEVAKVNTDENAEWAMHFGVQGIPTLLFVDRGEVKDRLVGAAPAPSLKARAEALIKKSQPASE